MKILMTGLLPFDTNLNNGGVVSVIRNLLDGFAGKPDIEVCHISFNREIHTPEIQRPASNIRIRFIPYRSRFDLLDYILNRQVLDQVIREEQPDLIHIQEITPQILRFLHLDRSRIVVTQHGIMCEEQKHFQDLGSKLKGRFKAWIERLLFPRFPNIIFISEYNKRLFRKTPVHAEVILNPANRLFFTEYRKPGNPTSLLMVAAFSKIKNLELLLGAVARLNTIGLVCQLHLAGGFKKKSYENSIRQRIMTLKLQDQVIFHGWCSPRQVLQLLNECEIFVLPSRQETLPVAVAEAMATGRVVVASDVGAVSEMFIDGQSGLLFPDNDLEALESQLRRILLHPAERENLARRARDRAHAQFHPDIIAHKTIAFYQKVLSASTTTKPA